MIVWKGKRIKFKDSHLQWHEGIIIGIRSNQFHQLIELRLRSFDAANSYHSHMTRKGFLMRLYQWTVRSFRYWVQIHPDVMALLQPTPDTSRG